MKFSIRTVEREDLPALKEVLDSTELFPKELLEGMISNFLEDPNSQDIWFTATHLSKPISIGYCAPERMTEGTYNLYAIAVHHDYQGQGIGSEMLEFIESMLRAAGHRLLLVETSGLPEFKNTRKFYEKCVYRRQAVIPDFYKEGEDKIVYWKKISEI